FQPQRDGRLSPLSPHGYNLRVRSGWPYGVSIASSARGLRGLCCSSRLYPFDEASSPGPLRKCSAVHRISGANSLAISPGYYNYSVPAGRYTGNIGGPLLVSRRGLLDRPTLVRDRGAKGIYLSVDLFAFYHRGDRL